MYYSDNVMNTISRADLVVGGGKVIQIADTGMNAVGRETPLFQHHEWRTPLYTVELLYSNTLK